MAEDPDIAYLMKDNIGKVLAKGLAEVYRKQPTFPVDFLAKWLLNYSVSVERENELEEGKRQKERLKHKHEEELHTQEVERQKQEAILAADRKIDEDFREYIRNHLYHEEILLKDLPHHIENRKHLTGAYVSILDFQIKKFDWEEIDDDTAHIDKNNPQQLRYIGSSNLAHDFLLGKYLQLGAGVTYDIFKPPEEQQQPPDGGEVPHKPNYIYVPNVIKEPRMHFWTIPKLGAYMAVPMFVYSCLSEQAFEKGLRDHLDYQKQLADQEADKKDKEEQFKVLLKEKEDAGEDTTELKAEFDRIMSEIPVIPEPEYDSLKKEYVLCVDTMGQDREISLEERSYIEEFVKLTVQSWEDMEKNLMRSDIKRQLAYLEGIRHNIEEHSSAYQLEEDKAVEEKRHMLEEEFRDNELELNYNLDCLRLERNKQFLKEEDTKRFLKMLAEYRVVRFPFIIQCALFLIGYTKKEVNLPGKNQLDWKSVQKIIADDDKFLKRILAYDHKGPKEKVVPKYAMILRLTGRISKLLQEEVDTFNLGLGRLFKWLSLTLKLRKQDIEIRRIHKEKQRVEREEKIRANNQKEVEKATALEEHKGALPPEELEVFDPEEWARLWDESHPLDVIPDEVVEDIDNDYEE